MFVFQVATIMVSFFQGQQVLAHLKKDIPFEDAEGMRQQCLHNTSSQTVRPIAPVALCLS